VFLFNAHLLFFIALRAETIEGFISKEELAFLAFRARIIGVHGISN
jgi:hypothetical protein